jgi:hypothetical protein
MTGPDFAEGRLIVHARAGEISQDAEKPQCQHQNDAGQKQQREYSMHCRILPGGDVLGM